jgi:hypothetical protein
MAMTCPECGAAVPEGGTCRDNFHALLLLESAIPGGPGSLAQLLLMRPPVIVDIRIDPRDL